MRVRQILVAAVLLSTGAALVAGSAVGLGADLTTDEQEPNGMGVQVSSFAQATAADANTTIETGMWKVSVEETDNPEELVQQRIERLERRLGQLQNLSEQLDQAANGSVGPLDIARASAVRAELSSMQSVLQETEQTAQRFGVKAAELDTLQSRASNLTGPEVAEITSNITDIPGGPSDGSPGNPSDDAGDDDETGPPDDVGDGNETETPDDGEDGGETGPPDDGGDGDETPDDGGDGDETPDDADDGDETPDDADDGDETETPDDGGDGDETPDDADDGDETPDDGGDGGETGPSDDAGDGDESESSDDDSTGDNTGNESR